MSGLHMIRPFSARQLHLVAGDGLVEAFAVLGGQTRGPSVDVHVPTLRRRMRDLARHIRTIVFFDEPVPDGPLVALIDDMVEDFVGDASLDVLAMGVPATEAVKWVEDDVIVSEVDRSRLVRVRCPEVVDRAALDEALEDVGD
ncbi:MAG: hypothetical protein R3246_03110, partial [Acidimicrobiia bacterium]|nr:hypothetical protein [Acidimicrobiia bacterium]